MISVFIKMFKRLKAIKDFNDTSFSEKEDKSE
jgi:hypothetical protein